MNQPCQVFKRAILGRARILHRGLHSPATRIANADAWTQVPPARANLAADTSLPQTEGASGTLLLKVPAPSDHTRSINQHQIPRSVSDAMISRFAAIASQSLAPSLSQEEQARQTQQYLEQIRVIFARPISPPARVAVISLIKDPHSPASITRRLIATLIQHHRFAEATTLHAISVRFGLSTSPKDLTYIVHALQSALHHQCRHMSAGIHLANYLISKLRQVLAPTGHNQNAKHLKCAQQSLTCLISVMYRLKAFDKVLFLQQLAQSHNLILSPASYNLVFESIFRSRRLGGGVPFYPVESLISTLGQVMKQMDDDRTAITIEGKATLLRLLGNMLLESQHDKNVQKLSENDDWRQIVSRILGLDVSPPRLQPTSKPVGGSTVQQQGSVVFPRLNPTLLFTWTELLLQDRESSPNILPRRARQALSTSPNLITSDNDPWTVEFAIRCIINREWKLQSTNETGQPIDSTRFAIEQYITELRRSEILARYALHNNSLHEAFRHVHQMYLYSRRYHRRIVDVPPSHLSKNAARHHQAIVCKGARTIAMRLDSVLRRIWIRVRDQRRYDLIPRTLAASRVVALDSGPYGTFSSLWKSLLHLSQLAQDKDRLLAEGLRILSQVFDEQEARIQKETNQAPETAKKRRRLVILIRKLYSKPALVHATFHAIVNRSLQEAAPHRGKAAVRVFQDQLRQQFDVLNRLEIQFPESLVKEDHVGMLRRIHPQGGKFGEVVSVVLGSWMQSGKQTVAPARVKRRCNNMDV